MRASPIRLEPGLECHTTMIDWIGPTASPLVISLVGMPFLLEMGENVDRVGELGPQLTALFTSAAILFSLATVNSFSANETGHRAPSSRFAVSLKPKVAYLELNF